MAGTNYESIDRSIGIWFHRSQSTSRNAASIPRNVADGPGDPLTPRNSYVGPGSLSTTAYVYCYSS